MAAQQAHGTGKQADEQPQGEHHQDDQRKRRLPFQAEEIPQRDRVAVQGRESQQEKEQDDFYGECQQTHEGSRVLE